jgi:hypothetical protein
LPSKRAQKKTRNLFLFCLERWGMEKVPLAMPSLKINA